MSAAEDNASLLKRFQPRLRYDSLEGYFADSAEEWTANPCNRLCRADGTVIATAEDRLSLAFLDAPNYNGDGEAKATDHIESERDDYSDQYLELRREHPELRNVIYGRAVPSHDGLWLQYWFFYFLNDYQLAWGIDVHEGDWEMVQLRIPAGESEPEIAAYAQHDFCEVRSWHDVRRLADEKRQEGLAVDDGDADRPLVYVGRGSHASFFTPGYHPTDFYDVTDGRRRPKTEARLEAIGEDPPGWLRWPGHWGGSRSGYAGPGAPCAHSQWSDPASLLAKRPKVSEGDAEPDAPRLWARRRRNRLLLEFDFSRMKEPPKRLIANVNSEDEPKVPPRVFRFAVRTVVRGSLQTNVALDPRKHYDVSIAIVDAHDRPSEAEIVFFDPSEGLAGVYHRLGEAAGRLVHLVRLAFGSG
jgi:hypothetical protein